MSKEHLDYIIKYLIKYVHSDVNFIEFIVVSYKSITPKKDITY